MKGELISATVNTLLKHEYEFLNNILLKLCIANAHVVGSYSGGFFLAGKFWSPYGHVPTRKNFHNYPSDYLIAPEFTGRGYKYIEDIQHLKKDEKLMNQGFTNLLHNCVTIQDIRDALPDVLKRSVPSYLNVFDTPRTRPEAWPFLENPMQMHNYESLKKLIYYYLTNRMIR